jgi:hypothetical protein
MRRPPLVTQGLQMYWSSVPVLRGLRREWGAVRFAITGSIYWVIRRLATLVASQAMHVPCTWIVVVCPADKLLRALLSQRKPSADTRPER